MGGLLVGAGCDDDTHTIKPDSGTVKSDGVKFPDAHPDGPRDGAALDSRPDVARPDVPRPDAALPDGAATGGGHVWSKRFGSTGNDRAPAVAVHGLSDVFLAGHFEDTVDFGGGPLPAAGLGDVFVANYGSAGNHKWSKPMGGTGNDSARAVASGADGSLYVIGQFEGTANLGGSSLTSAGGPDVFVAAYDAVGNHRWSKGVGGTEFDFGSGVAVDTAGNVFVTGYFSNTADFGGGPLTSAGATDIFLASYDAAGNHRWSKRYGGTSLDSGYAVAVDGSGNVYLTGRFDEALDVGGAPLTCAGKSDVFLASFTSTGAHRWSKSFGGPGQDLGIGLDLDSSGNIYVTGSFEDTVNFGGGPLTSSGGLDVFVASYTWVGTHRWSRRFGGVGDDYGFRVAAQDGTAVYVTGQFEGTVDFGGGPLVSAGQADAWVASYTPLGDHRWSTRFGSTDIDQGIGVATATNGNVYVTGFFGGTVDFGGGPLSSAGSNDAFLVALSP
jgi:hypothetical protein